MRKVHKNNTHIYIYKSEVIQSSNLWIQSFMLALHTG